MNNENKNDEINFEELEKLIISTTKDLIDNNQYVDILKDEDEKEEEITKVYKIR